MRNKKGKKIFLLDKGKTGSRRVKRWVDNSTPFPVGFEGVKYTYIGIKGSSKTMREAERTTVGGSGKTFELPRCLSHNEINSRGFGARLTKLFREDSRARSKQSGAEPKTSKRERVERKRVEWSRVETYYIKVRDKKKKEIKGPNFAFPSYTHVRE